MTRQEERRRPRTAGRRIDDMSVTELAREARKITQRINTTVAELDSRLRFLEKTVRDRDDEIARLLIEIGTLKRTG